MNPSTVASARKRLEQYVRAQNWGGWDPFDGLNSRVFQATPFRRSRFARLALLQACKRSPVNLRPWLAVPREHNNKGLGLFLASAARLAKHTGEAGYEAEARQFVDWLAAGVSPGFHGACWGYNFDWQARAFFQPKGTPTVVATTFVANALLDAHAQWGWPQPLSLARSACEFVLQDLNRTREGERFCFSYSPEDRSQVYNATLLGSQLLARVGALTGEPELFDAARRSVEYVLARQRADGAWAYGNLSYHDWVDSFHTGFNLDCLDDYVRYTGDEAPREAIARGFAYFRAHFFLPDGTPKYYDRETYPIDAHSGAQAILTLLRFGDRAMAETVADWMIREMQSAEGYFYYQRTRRSLNRIPYMRWVQAWMFRALVELETHMAQNSEEASSGA